MSTPPASPLTSLPVDLLVDHILPALSISSLVSLGATNKTFRHFLASPEGELVWKHRCIRDFRFPASASGRRTGWKELYRRLSTSAAFVWGQNANGRLGIAADDHSLRNRLIGRMGVGLTTPTRLELPAPPISLAASGWAFHALTTTGTVVSWGTLDGGSFVMGNAALSNPGRVLQQPREHPNAEEMGEIVQLEAGRKHVLARGRSGEVWEWRCWGRTARIEDSAGRWGVGRGTGNEVIAVDAGWDHSLVLTKDGNVFVWWEQGLGPVGRASKEAGEAELVDPSVDGVAFPLSVETLQLPSVPSPLPSEKIELVASGDHFIIALTTSSRLFFLDISPESMAPQGGDDDEDSPARGSASRSWLEGAFMNGRRQWTLMEWFCDMDRVRALDAFRDNAPSQETRLTHISAHFNSFCVYSVPASSDPRGSIVLLGDNEWTPDKLPTVVPELQAKSVIKVAQGDYHHLAMTSTGQLFSWGAYSAGALGLGHPQLTGTPLSAPSSSLPTRPPPPAPTRGRNIFPGFAPGRPAPVIPDPPERVDTPTLVRFPGDDDATTDVVAAGEGQRQKGKFVFAITAGGWHSGALAVELDDQEGEEEELAIRLKGDDDDNSPARHDESLMREGGSLARGRFRIGFAGRGLGRGMRGVGR